MTEFREVQKIRQWWIWLILLGVAGLWAWGIYYQIILDKPFGRQPLSDASLLITTIIPISLLALFSTISLKTVVTSRGIKVQYYPMWSTFYSWDQIKSAEIVTYKFIGYGIRYTVKHGTVYNAHGNVGLQLHKTHGENLLIGTQQPEELNQAVQKYLKKESSHR